MRAMENDMNTIREKLLALYNKTSRHSQYQQLASQFKCIFGEKERTSYSKYEKERFNYIESKIDFSCKKILDIGGNTGYFTFEALNRGVDEVDYYEGNGDHAEFVSVAARLFGLADKIYVHKAYFDFPPKNEKVFDIAFLLNVVHHLGFDFGDRKSDRNTAKEKMLQVINNMSVYTKVLVFQNGFNWKGDIHECLFAHGEKSEMIEWLCEGTKDFWEIENIGIAEGKKGNARYFDRNDNNVERDDSLGEFLNRPLFLMRSLNC